MLVLELLFILFGRLTPYPICFRTFLRKFFPCWTFAESHHGCFLLDTIIRDNIRYDLLRTGNVGRTTEKILERGFLDAVRTHISLLRGSSDLMEYIATTCILYALPPSN